MHTMFPLYMHARQTLRPVGAAPNPAAAADAHAEPAQTAPTDCNSGYDDAPEFAFDKDDFMSRLAAGLLTSHKKEHIPSCVRAPALVHSPAQALTESLILHTFIIRHCSEVRAGILSTPILYLYNRMGTLSNHGALHGTSLYTSYPIAGQNCSVPPHLDCLGC